MNRFVGRSARVVFFMLVALYAAYLVRSVAVNRIDFQWDFKLYYHAAETYARDLNPYVAGLVLLLVMPVSTPRPDAKWIRTLFANYPLILAFVFWGFYIAYFNERAGRHATNVVPSP